MNANNNQQNTQILEPQDALPPLSYAHLPLAMQEAVQRAGWTELTLVQSRAIPYFQANRDLMVQARTGSGKTGAFLLPIIERVNPTVKTCQALVLAPTRELAQQVTADANILAGRGGMRTVPVYGGTSYKPQIDGFRQGAQLVVGTPGRLLDHLHKRNLSLENLKILVFDEADRLMSMGFYQDMLRLRDYLPDDGGDRSIHTTMFSATFPTQVMRLAYRFLNQPGFLSLSRDHVHVEDTEHVYYIVPGMDKDRSLVRIIEMENPNQTLIFCNTRDRVNYVTAVLQRFGYNADQISSDLSQKERDKVLTRFREGKLRFLVATDVAARGLDISDLSHVIQYEPPDDLEAYIHRAGRTGRAGASGTALLLINLNEKRQLTRIAAHYKIEFEERPLPQDEDIQSLVSQRLIGQLESRLRDRDRLQIERMQRFLPLVKELTADEDGAALIAMLLDDTYHAWMHKPPELAPVTDSTGKQKGSKRRNRSQRRRRRSGKPKSRRKDRS